MADEDEVDVLGDFNLENLLNKDENRLTSCYDGGGSDLLSEWYQDGGSPPWFERSQLDSFSPISFPLPLSSSPNSLQWSDPSPSTINPTTTPNWSDKECKLLEEGLELFGRSWTRLSQYIGTKSSNQVKSYLKMVRPNSESEALSFSLSSLVDGSTILNNVPSSLVNESHLADTELIDDMQIPASIEEVIAVVSTAQPTVTTGQSHLSRSPETGGAAKRKKHKILKLSKAKRGRPPRVDSVKHPQKRGRGRPRKTTSVVHDANGPEGINLISELTETPDLGEEVVRIRKEGSHSSDDTDVEVDIEDVDESETKCDTYTAKSTTPESKYSEEEKAMDVREDSNQIGSTTPSSSYVSGNETNVNVKMENQIGSNTPSSSYVCGNETNVNVKMEIYDPNQGGSDLSNVLKEGKMISHQDLLDRIHSLPPPVCERVLSPSEITDEERTIHSEFFEGRPAKTPKRYLKIRNHIIDSWLQSRPSYVTKTSVRAGLRNCGDVNCIGRIHSYLEQTGVINFGCEQTKYNYVPQAVTGSVVKQPSVCSSKDKSNRELLCIEGMRPRKKKRDINEELLGSVQGGYTIQHTEDGQSTLTYNSVVKTRNPRSDSSIKLMYCAKFSSEKPAPFTVHLHIGALLVIDVHAHCSHDKEIMGLLGGELRQDSLHIVRAVSCQSSLSSSIHCDMCPVSQSEASDTISKEGLSVVGWYHSHPTFLPNPSLQDLSTQAEMQRWFSDATAAPFVGLILSPYCISSSSLASQFSVLIVDPEGESGGTPYRFPVNVVAEDEDIDEILSHVDETVISLGNHILDGPPFAISSTKPMSCLHKCLESIRAHLESCHPSFTLEERKRIIKGIHFICKIRSNFQQHPVVESTSVF